MSVTSIITSISSAVRALVPMVEDAAAIIDPAAAAIISKAATIVNGAASLEPTLVTVYNKIVSGVPYTDTEIAADMADYEVDFHVEITEAEAKGATLE